MRRHNTIYCLWVIFCVCAVPVASNITSGSFDYVYDNDNETESSETSQEYASELGNLTTELRMATICETPNHEPAYCIEIKQCHILLKQLNNTKARAFLRESACGPKHQDPTNPKVCCGKYDNFRNVSTNIVDDSKIFPKICGQQKVAVRGRIVGGKEATLGEYPWMARLTHKNKYGYKSFGCSGFLIHVKYVLTAAHCTRSEQIQIRGPLYSVVLGEHNTETDVDCSARGRICAEPKQISRVAKVITHEKYDPESYAHYNDIALIHMKKGARLTDYVQPICLNKDDSEKPPHFYLSGWGKTEQGPTSKIKMKVEIPSVNKRECKEKYSLLQINLKDTQICAGGEEGKDACTGDSGGPLMMSSDNGTYYAAGIVSYGIGCGMKGWPGVYTNIVKYLPWIRNQILLNSMVSARNPKKGKKHRNKKVTDTQKTENSTMAVTVN